MPATAFWVNPPSCLQEGSPKLLSTMGLTSNPMKWRARGKKRLQFGGTNDSVGEPHDDRSKEGISHIYTLNWTTNQNVDRRIEPHISESNDRSTQSPGIRRGLATYLESNNKSEHRSTNRTTYLCSRRLLSAHAMASRVGAHGCLLHPRLRRS